MAGYAIGLNIFNAPPGFGGMTLPATVKPLGGGLSTLTNITLNEVNPGNYNTTIDVDVAPTPVAPEPAFRPTPVTSPSIKPIPSEITVDFGEEQDVDERYIVGSNAIISHEAIASPLRQNQILTQIPPSPGQEEVKTIIRCPYCFSHIEGTTYESDLPRWTDDPILMTGSRIMKIYRGYQQLKAQHIIELQNNRKQLEEDLSIDPATNFTYVDEDNFYQNIYLYVQELRDSTEKILEAVGMDKETYFNYDEEGEDKRPGNHQMDWIDLTDNLTLFQIKGQHIEELRHYIAVGFREDWSEAAIYDAGFGTPGIIGPSNFFPGLDDKIWVAGTTGWVNPNQIPYINNGYGEWMRADWFWTAHLNNAGQYNDGSSPNKTYPPLPAGHAYLGSQGQQSNLVATLSPNKIRIKVRHGDYSLRGQFPWTTYHACYQDSDNGKVVGAVNWFWKEEENYPYYPSMPLFWEGKSTHPYYHIGTTAKIKLDITDVVYTASGDNDNLVIAIWLKTYLDNSDFKIVYGIQEFDIETVIVSRFVIGHYEFNLYTDLLSRYPDLIKYYGGSEEVEALDTKGCYIYKVTVGLGASFFSTYSGNVYNEVEFTNLKIM